MLAKLFPIETYGITFNAVHPGLVATKLLDVAPGFCNYNNICRNDLCHR